jgi:hypothetical protein
MEHIKRINTGTIPKQILGYQAREQRSTGCPTTTREEENLQATQTNTYQEEEAEHIITNKINLSD